jgi:glycosyltransferase involved in cell wall biosynthesis
LELLDALVTDLWAAPRWRTRGRALSAARRFGTRWHPEIPDERVVAFAGSALWVRATGFLRRPRTTEESSLEYLRIGERFARDSRRYLVRRLRSSPPPSAFFTYSTGALEALELLAERGVPSIVDQIDPARTEEEIVRREEALWPDWAAPSGRIPDVYFHRLAAEWTRASIVVVNSEWCRAGLIRQGVPAEKLRVLPLAYDGPPLPPTATRSRVRTILWLGQVVLRKGIQYLMAAARLLPAEHLRFLVAGPIGISAEAMRSAPSNMSFIGPIPRDRASELYLEADLFAFPTLSDGFGVTQLEAMAHGVPVISTRNCGEVVEHGVNGLIVPAQDAESLAEAIRDVAFDDRRLESMSVAARETAKRFSIQVLSERLRVILDELQEEF